MLNFRRQNQNIHIFSEKIVKTKKEKDVILTFAFLNKKEPQIQKKLSGKLFQITKHNSKQYQPVYQLCYPLLNSKLSTVLDFKCYI